MSRNALTAGVLRPTRDLDTSRRRALHRDRVLRALVKAHSASVGELARMTGIRPYRIRGILLGDGQEYAFDLSLVAQGAVQGTRVGGRTWFTITPAGEEEAEKRVR